MAHNRTGRWAWLAEALVALAIGTSAHAQVVISQVYGAGGNSGAPYRNDYVELFNRGAAPVSLTGWSVQYASATSTGNLGANPVTALSGTLAPGQYYLVQLAGGANGAALPTPDATGTVNMSGSAGKVALVNATTGLACNGGSTPCSAAQLAQILDLVGYGNANFYEGTGTAPTLSTGTAAFRTAGCVDTNDNAADFSAAAPAPRNTASTLNVCPIESAPSVTGVVPVNGAVNVAPDTNLVVTFSEPVNLGGNWFSLTCATSGLIQPADTLVTGGPTTFTIDSPADLADGEACTLTVFANAVSDQDSNDPPDRMVADFASSFTTIVVNPCLLPYTAIPSIQGSGATVAITGTVSTLGVVVGDYEGPSPALRGFFIQDPNGDGNPATSDGIFVFNGSNDSNANSVSLGQVVRVTGTAGENQGQSQISVSASNIVACGTGSVTPVDVTFPVASSDDLERFEGMLVRLPQTMSVTEHFQLGRFGQVVLSSGGRLSQPTNTAAPGTPAIALQAANNLNRIVVDDASQVQNPDPIVFARGGLPLSAANTLRGGDTVTGLVGVMTYTWGGNSASPNAYRIRPVNALGGVASFVPSNPRPAAAPDVGGTLRIASASLSNYYNTFTGCTAGVGAAPIDCRGASNAAEFARQWPKTVSALLATGADVIGVTELENDGYGPESAILHLVNRLDAATAPGTWAFVDADAWAGVNALGSDGIRVGLLYQPARVTPVGHAAVLNTGAYGLFVLADGRIQQRNRPALAQTYQTATGARVTVVVNHLISKGASCELNVSPVGPDPDTGDGQGACNLTRLAGIEQLREWLATDPTGAGDPDYVLVGDFNAYAREDPVTALAAAGWVDLLPSFGGLATYSYAFDGQWGALDHAIASPSLAGQVTGAGSFHVNADEPSVLNYNLEFKTANLQAALYAPDAFRAGDHDPLVIGIALNAAPVASAGGPYQVLQNQSVVLQATGNDPDGGPVTFAWDLDNDGTFETAGQNAVFSTTSHVGTFTVRVQVTDEGGLSAVASTTVTVLFDWSGFFPPVKAYPEWNPTRAGSAVPIKFALGGDQGLDVFATGFPVSLPIDCVTGAPGTGSPTANPGGSGLSHDSGGGQYVYVWKTEKAWSGSCRLLVVQLVDGSMHQAVFRFR